MALFLGGTAGAGVYCPHMPDELFARSIALHKEHGGKIGLANKVPLETKEDLSLAYTPGVAGVSSAIGVDPEAAYEYTLKKNTIAVVSDGSAILGLGNLGALAAIPVMEGKAAIFKKFAGLDAFPICLETQDTEEIIETVKRIAPVFGGINLEDIAAPRCFEIERRLREELAIPVMHDDQHGTATVVLAGLINALAVAGLEARTAKVVINGAGSAGNAIANLLIAYGFGDLTVLDSKGILSHERADLEGEKRSLAERTNPRGIEGGLSAAVAGADVFIGVSKAGVLTEDMVRSMNTKPVIFGLANPIPEIMPDKARDAGAFIVATGRSDFPNQVNNALVFPGLFKGALRSRRMQFGEAVFLRAAKALAEMAGEPSPERILPTIFEEGLADRIARAVSEIE